MNHQEIADRLREAEEKRRPLDSLPEMALKDAYEIQFRNAARRERLVGYKIGLTSREAQKHFGVFEPDFGHLFDAMAVPEEGEVKVAELIQPKIEAEIAFLLGRELKGPGLTVADAVRAVDGVMGAMEIIDSRIRDWKIRAADTIADNGSSARYVVGSRVVPLRNLDLRLLGMAMSRDGEVELSGAGAAVMGHPLNALVFLANELGRHGRSLSPGQVVLSGALSGMLPLKAGEHYCAEFLGLGKVTVHAR